MAKVLQGMKVLEVACGTGAQAVHFKKAGAMPKSGLLSFEQLRREGDVALEPGQPGISLVCLLLKLFDPVRQSPESSWIG